MVSGILEEVVLGIYIGLLTGIFPAFVAFSFGFGFRYFTNVTVPGLGVVALAGALAGVSGGLLGILSPEIAESWIGITAVVVILMAALWAHAVGDALGAKTPRNLTIQRIKEHRLSADLVERVDSYGQIIVRPTGAVDDIEGYPPLPDGVREALATGSWKFPGTLPLPEIERRLEERLIHEYELTEISVSVDRRGRARIAAAPTSAGLSRRLPKGSRAVTLQTLLPTGLARGDSVALRLPDEMITGTVVSARSDAPVEPEVTTSGEPEDGESEEQEPAPAPKAPTTTGGAGQVTVAVDKQSAVRLLAVESVPIVVHSRGKRREYETVALLKRAGNRFSRHTIGDGTPLAGVAIADLELEREHDVTVLAVRRGQEIVIAPGAAYRFTPNDEIVVVGTPQQISQFSEVMA